jgi:outer membrane protein assembly factor BamE
MTSRLLRSVLLAGCIIVTFPGCLYRQDIPQGNRIDAAVLEKLEIGMTRNQVKFLLGSPALVDTYRPERWQYVYFLKTGDDQKIVRRNMTLVFTDDLLSEIEGTLNPNPG